MTLFRSMFVLMIVCVCILMVVGCTTKPALENPAGTPTPSSKALYKVTIAQPNGSHAEFMKMDSDVYNVGEVVEFYVVNEGPETLTCANTPPSFRIYYKKDDNTWEYQTEAGETMSPRISYLKPGDSTRLRRLITTDWTPGRYRIVFDGGISRVFELREISKL
ncbi:hypothetical protein [Methanoregula sp.]|uniref:hypothetical protein n=1 Tax=Methanoregula sp. TaxID=2052170 RepID=UPI0035648F24